MVIIKRKNGFSLIEVLLIGTFFALFGVGILVVTPKLEQRKSNNITQAVNNKAVENNPEVEKQQDYPTDSFFNKKLLNSFNLTTNK